MTNLQRGGTGNIPNSLSFIVEQILDRYRNQYQRLGPLENFILTRRRLNLTTTDRDLIIFFKIPSYSPILSLVIELGNTLAASSDKTTATEILPIIHQLESLSL